MRKTGYAFFVRRPRVLGELVELHSIECERPYEIVKTVRLGAMDYENFVTDMVADRQFVEDNAEYCSTGEVWKCLLVQKRGNRGGILVMPEDNCYVGYAAYAPEV